MTSCAVLFDIDGTLVDSNYLHVQTWFRALRDVGTPVPAWRIHRSIGMDGSTLVDTLTDGAPDSVQEHAKELHSSYYKQMWPLLDTFPGARELLERVEKLGLQVVLATSAPEDELAVLCKVLDRDDVISAVTSSKDVDEAKPDPTIVEIALQRAGVGPEQAVFIGDTVWDTKACVRAGVPSIGVLTGGISRDELESAGAAAVFENVAELCESLQQERITGPIGDLLD
ncbi:HAD family hydrolase [Skermania sp. ID1734]|uniref:HAD family hydrolase n=1 Tax=Skermania sp. ID1734 TaxID=2597516 RepID=UPI001180EDA1|nr:HAD family hydrolase [Skermania sp. ID1734]TSE02029.1 HAD family hydrolase [Skermania sp. ID1734]